MIRYAANLMIFLSIITILFLGYSHSTNTPLFIHPEFRSFFKEFKNDASKHKVTPDFYKLTTVFVDDMEIGLAGYCRPALNYIAISSRVWQTLSTESKKALLYHEWGHCTLRRDHTEDAFLTMAYGACPLSLMYPSLEPISKCYSELKEAYIRELFTNPFNYKLLPRRIE